VSIECPLCKGKGKIPIELYQIVIKSLASILTSDRRGDAHFNKDKA